MDVFKQLLVFQEVGSTAMPQWQRRELQAILKALQRAANTAIRKLEISQVRAQQQDLWQLCSLLKATRLFSTEWADSLSLIFPYTRTTAVLFIRGTTPRNQIPGNAGEGEAISSCVGEVHVALLVADSPNLHSKSSILV